MPKVPDYISSAASRGLELLEYAGDGLRPKTVAEARQLAQGTASPDKVRRMAAWFSRHQVDLRSPDATAYLRGDRERPTAGQVAWLLWGGALGDNRLEAMRWAEKERDRLIEEGELKKANAPGIAKLVEEHNKKYGNNKTKRATPAMLQAVYNRGIGAYRTNPESVRPNVSSSQQWAYARVRGFLQALGTGRFKRGAYDRDLLPEGHPLSTKGE